jgi:hypothetical protein
VGRLVADSTGEGDNMMVDVASVNLFRRQAILTDGQIIPITLLIDSTGEDTDDLEKVVAFATGPDKHGYSFHEQVASYGFISKNTLN